jgi:hypothetical protein
MHFLFFITLPSSQGDKISFSYTRLKRKVPFGTDGFNARLRNFETLQATRFCRAFPD